MPIGKVTLIATFVIMLSSCKSDQVGKDNPLIGSWTVERLEWISDDTIIVRVPRQKGLLLVTPVRYSICWTPNEDIRTPFLELGQPTSEEILEGFSSIVFNTGSYTWNDSLFVTQAHLAKVPGFEGGKQYYHYIESGDRMTLSLVDETYPGGKKPDWLGIWTTKFNLKRVAE